MNQCGPKTFMLSSTKRKLLGQIFLDDHLRDNLAKRGDILCLKKTYDFRKFVKGLDNLNSGSHWAKMTQETTENLISSPVYIDKINTILKFLRQENGRLLSIGFGNGFLEKKLVVEGYQVFGVDPSKGLVTVAKNEIEGYFMEGVADSLPYESSFFDFVMALDVMEHIQAPKILKVLREVKRVLKKNGVFIISVPLNEHLEELVAAGSNPNSHMRVYTPDILRMELSFFGFSIFKEYYLYAFTNFYVLKGLLMKLIPRFRKPNLLIVYCLKK